ncbi:MAG: hypothetical protein IJI45_16590 [Anaerolineaceae bacterium]|nr:hypothetical protein [Anaerolineaceae bacterium]
MAEYHVGCGSFGIYAGTLDKSKAAWRNKSDVTHEALCAVAQHLLFNGVEFRFQHKNQWYVMKIEQLGEEQ